MTDSTEEEFRFEGRKDKGCVCPEGGEGIMESAKETVSRMEGVVTKGLI